MPPDFSVLVTSFSMFRAISLGSTTSGTEETMKSAFSKPYRLRYSPIFSAESHIRCRRLSFTSFLMISQNLSFISKEIRTASGCIFSKIALVMHPSPAPSSTIQRALLKSIGAMMFLTKNLELKVIVPTVFRFLKA